MTSQHDSPMPRLARLPWVLAALAVPCLIWTSTGAEATNSDPDCNGNGVSDAQDLINGDSEDLNENGVPDECESLVANVESVSVEEGGTQDFVLNAGSDFAGYEYRVLGSSDIVDPGSQVGTVVIPLDTSDPYFATTWNDASNSPLSDGAGILDGEGRAAASFEVPPETSEVLAGTEVHHAYVVFDQSGNMVYASDTTSVELTE